tara:strand:- start:13944 stop:16022 length:2079 start_codon:yes stop_codon:yes gene_type:complete
MATNRLVLRSAASPYIFPLPDIVKGSVLAWDEVDNNFIFLKGLDIRSGSVSGSDLVLDRINGSNVTIDLSAFSGGSGTNYYTTGLTFNSGTYDLTVSLNNGSAFTQSLGILSGDMTITGGTYNPSNGVGTFTNNSGGTFGVTGFLTGYTDTDKFVTGGTYNSSAATITFTNNSGGTFTVTDISGGTSSGVYSQTNNYTSGVTQTINHSAGTTDVLVQIINTSTNELVSGDIDNYQTNSLDVTLSQTLSNIKVVVVGGASGGGGGGGTSPAGSNTQIQFNDSGSFGANTGFTYSALTNAFSTKSNYGTKSINLGSGVVDMGPFGTLTGITGNRYNNSLSGASANSFFIQGDLSALGGLDNSTFFGYSNQSTNLISSVNLNPDSSALNYNTSGNTVQSNITLNATQSQLKRTNNSLNTQSRITLTDSDTEVYFQDSNNSKDAFLDLTADAINLNLNKTGIPSGTTGFYISDTAINANLGNSGASQSFSVSNMTPSGWVKRLEVEDSGQVTISDRLDIGTSNTNNSTLTLISGINNEIGSGSTGSVILGGTGNTITSGATISTIITGFDNQVNSNASIIAGGSGNTSNGNLSTMVAGVDNKVNYSGVNGGIIGGVGNVLDNDNSWIIGGLNISATTDFTTYVESLNVGGGLTLGDIFTVSGGTTGSGATVPSTVEGFIQVNINGTNMLIPYFPVP